MNSRLNGPLGAAAIAALLAASPANAADRSGNFVLRGAGSQVCPAFMTAINSRDKEASTTYLAWFQGYLSAHNRLTPEIFDIMPTQGPADFMGVVKAICEKAPQFSVENAAHQAIALLRPLAQAAPSALVRLDHKGKTANVRENVLKQLETRLVALGHLRSVAPDGGRVPADLHAAIEKFQRAEKLDVTGLPDLATLLRAQAGRPAK